MIREVLLEQLDKSTKSRATILYKSTNNYWRAVKKCVRLGLAVVAVQGPMNEKREVRDPDRKVIMIPCKYCSALFPQTATFCPTYGARRTP